MTVSSSVTHAKGKSRRVSLTPLEVVSQPKMSGGEASGSAILSACDWGTSEVPFQSWSSVDGFDRLECTNGPKYPPPPLSEEFWGAPSTGNCDNVTVPNRYPLMEELFALNELVDNMRVDLLQGSMLLDYIKDYLQKNTHQ